MTMTIRYAALEDQDFWFGLDQHLSLAVFVDKVQKRQGYLLLVEDKPAALLRYQLFWDNTPFCTMLYVADEYQRRGCGRRLMAYWEDEMKALGYEMTLVSTRSDEDAQHFYRRLGYNDCGALLLQGQPTELFLVKYLR